MRQYLIILTSIFILIGWTSTANARTDHRSGYGSKPHYSKSHHKQSKKHYRQERRRSYNQSYRGSPRHYNSGFRVDLHYGYYNNQRFNRQSHHGRTYYSNNRGYYFPNYGYIDNSHHHSNRCPSWHSKSFVTGALLGALLAH